MNKTNLGVALVTGASSGIGHATAKALLEAGFRVFGTSRRAAGERTDGVTMLTCDVTDDASVAKLVDDVLAKAGRIDLLVNNAGMGLFGGAEESSTAQAQALFDVNVFGVLRVTNAVLPAMRRQGKGRIVNLSSVQGFIPAPYFALYASRRRARSGGGDGVESRHRTRSEEALRGGKDGAPGQSPAPFRPRDRIRQEPAKAARATGLRGGFAREHRPDWGPTSGARQSVDQRRQDGAVVLG